MKLNLDEIEKALGDKAEQGWHKDPENRISVIRTLRDGELDGHHNLICQCNGPRFEGKEDLVDFIANAPEWLRLLVERVRKLEQFKYDITAYAEMMQCGLGPEGDAEQGIYDAIAAFDKEST